MNSLPLISHHLFVEAIAHNDRSPGKSGAAPARRNGAQTIALVLMDPREPLSLRAQRALRAKSGLESHR